MCVEFIIKIIIIIFLLAYIFKDYIRENYVSKDEKADTIYEWFRKNPDPRYVSYKKEVPESDIVEYSDIKKKSRLKTATPEAAITVREKTVKI